MAKKKKISPSRQFALDSWFNAEPWLVEPWKDVQKMYDPITENHRMIIKTIFGLIMRSKYMETGREWPCGEGQDAKFTENFIRDYHRDGLFQFDGRNGPLPDLGTTPPNRVKNQPSLSMTDLLKMHTPPTTVEELRVDEDRIRQLIREEMNEMKRGFK
jgi:hypothetical protein